MSPLKFLKLLDPMLLNGTEAIFNGIFLTWAGVSIAALGVWIIIQAFRGDIAFVVNAAGWALLVLTLVGALLLYPVQAGRTADGALTDTIGRLNAGFTGQQDLRTAARAPTVQIVDAVLYRQWLRGQFGSVDSPTARTYGPRLFKAQAVTWAENNASGQARKDLVKRKHDEFDKVSGEIKDKDPAAYEHLNGRADFRFGISLLTLITVLILSTFQIWTSIYIIYALFLVRGMVMLLPALAVAGLWLSAADLIRGVIALVGGP